HGSLCVLCDLSGELCNKASLDIYPTFCYLICVKPLIKGKIMLQIPKDGPKNQVCTDNFYYTLNKDAKTVTITDEKELEAYEPAFVREVNWTLFGKEGELSKLAARFPRIQLLNLNADVFSINEISQFKDLTSLKITNAFGLNCLKLAKGIG